MSNPEINENWNQCSLPCKDCWRLRAAMKPEEPDGGEESELRQFFNDID